MVKRRYSLGIVVSAGLVAMALVVVSAAYGKSLLPFKGSYSGTTTVIGGPANALKLALAASGNATHLGKSSETITATTNFTLACPMTSGTGEITAANGDKLFIAANGTSCPVAGQAGVYDLSGTQTVTGGTGRFAEASGTLTVAGTVNAITGALSYTLEGSIS